MVKRALGPGTAVENCNDSPPGDSVLLRRQIICLR